MNLFFNYSIDCELPANTHYTGGGERLPIFHGPKDWAFAEMSVRGFVEQMDGLGVRRGATLFVYPDVAREQSALYRAMADAGVEVALHLNGLRYSRLTGECAKWMGEMNRDEQREALRLAKADLEDAIDRPCTGYRPCYGSANDDTFPILRDLGFTWVSPPSGRRRPDFHANWRGAWPYPHHAHEKCRLVVGVMDLYKIPVTSGLTVMYDEALRQPLDLRIEPPAEKLGGDTRPHIRAVIDENVQEMALRESPVRTIIGASHNTSAYNDRTTHQACNLDWVVRNARESAEQVGLRFTPASFDDIRRHAESIGAY